MLFKPIRLWALLCFVLAIQLATAQSFQALKRQEPDGGPPATESASSPPPEQTDAPQSDSKQDGGDKAPESTLPSSDMTASITASPTSDPATETQATSTIAVSSALDNSTFLNGMFSVQNLGFSHQFLTFALQFPFPRASYQLPPKSLQDGALPVSLC